MKDNMALDWASLLGSGLGALGSVVSGNMSAAAQKQANKTNVYLAQYAYDKNLEMWNRENEYNSPVNQMKRFKAAGLNPNLIYTKGTAGNAESVPTYSAPQIAPVTGRAQGVANAFNYLANTADRLLDLRAKAAQIEGIKQDNIKKSIDADLAVDEHMDKKEWKRLHWAYMKNKQQADINLLPIETEARSAKAWADNTYYAWIEDKANIDREFYRDMMQADRSVKDTTASRNAASEAYLNTQNQYYGMMLAAKIAAIQSQISLNDSLGVIRGKEGKTKGTWREIGVKGKGIDLTLGQGADLIKSTYDFIKNLLK